MAKDYSELTFDVSPKLMSLLRSMNGEITDSELGKRILTAVQHALERKEWRSEYMNLMMRDQDNLVKGRKQGENLVAAMQLWLHNNGRNEDVTRSFMDASYRQLLLNEYQAFQVKEQNKL